MSEDCPKCINGWIQIGDNKFDMCDCLLGQAMRQSQGFLMVYGKQQEDDRIEQAFEWYKRKMGRVT